MEFTLSLLTNNQQYLILLAVVMGLSFTAKKTQIFLPVYRWISTKVKSKRALVAIISTISGILPISGRVAVSAGVLDTIAPQNEKRKKFGTIDYLSTHHYYFWSPLEATVLVPMAALGITYFEFISRIYPLLGVALIVILYYIFSVLKEDDVELDFSKKEQVSTWKEDRKQIASYAKTLVFVAVIIALGNIAKANSDYLKSILEGSHTNGFLLLVVVIGFLASFALGSSSKLAGFTALSTSVFGLEYLPLFFAVDYAGYMLSPVHKCLAIGKSYFGTGLKEYYKAIFALVIPIIAVSILLLLFVTT